jgi:nucleotide-binding universal stress UspA family protein
VVKSLFSTIVVAISGSEASIQATKYAIVLAKLYKCSLTAVYVVDSATIRQLAASRILVAEESVDFESSLHSNGKRYLAYAEELATAKGVRIECELREGAVWTEILAVAEKKEADLVVLGGWEKNKNPKDIISHLHREIMLHSKCSVLVSKERDIDIIYRQI